MQIHQSRRPTYLLLSNLREAVVEEYFSVLAKTGCQFAKQGHTQQEQERIVIRLDIMIQSHPHFRVLF
jgi:hypothetical protein